MYAHAMKLMFRLYICVADTSQHQNRFRHVGRVRRHQQSGSALHVTVNHSIEFVSGADPTVHTQTVEGLLANVKKNLGQCVGPAQPYSSCICRNMYGVTTIEGIFL